MKVVFLTGQYRSPKKVKDAAWHEMNDRYLFRKKHGIQATTEFIHDPILNTEVPCYNVSDMNQAIAFQNFINQQYMTLPESFPK